MDAPIIEATQEPEQGGHKWFARLHVFGLIKDTIRKMRARPTIADLELITAKCMPTMDEYKSLLLWWDRIDKMRNKRRNGSS